MTTRSQTTLPSELLQQQPPALQAFLVKTSILDRLCAPLCAAVLGTGEGAEDSAIVSASEHLHSLETNNLFLLCVGR